MENNKSKKTIIEKGWDTLETISNSLGLLQSIVAHSTAKAIKGDELDKGTWGYDWSDAYMDITGREAKDLNLAEKAGLLAANIIVDPLNFIPGGAARHLNKAKGLDLIQAGSKIDSTADFIKMKKTDLLKSAEKERKILEKAIDTLDNRTQKEAAKKSIEAIKNAEEFLKKNKGDSIEEMLDNTFKTKLSRFNPLNKNTIVLEKYRQPFDPSLYKAKAMGEKINQAKYIDDIKITPSKNIQSKKQLLETALQGTEQAIKNATETIKKTPEELVKVFDTLIKRNKDIIDSRLMERLTKNTKLDSQEITKNFKTYQKARRQIDTIQLIGGETADSLKGIPQLLQSESLLELKRRGEGLRQLALKERKADMKTLRELAKANKISYQDINKKLIRYIETGEKSGLNEAAIKYADEIVKPFNMRNYHIKKVLDQSLAEVPDYMPRRLKRSGEPITKKISNEFSDIVSFPFSFEKGAKMIVKDNKGISGSRKLRDLTAEEIQKLNKALPDRIELIEDIPALMQRLKDETIDMYQSKAGRLAIADYISPDDLRLKDHGSYIIKDLGTKTKFEKYLDQKNFAKTRKKLKEKGVPDSLIEELRKNSGSGQKYGAFLESIKNNEKYSEYYDLIKDMPFYKKTGIENVAVQIPDQVYKRFKDFIVRNNMTENKFSKLVKSMNGWWKMNSLSWIPSYHINNLADNLAVLLWDQPEAFNKMNKAWDLQKGKTVMLDTPKGKRAVNYTNLAETGILGGKYGIAENQAFLDSIDRMDEGTLKNIGSGLKRIMNKGFDFGNYLEDQFRIAVALDELAQGKTLKQASERIWQIFYDPSNINEKVRTARDYFMPFINFTLQNIPRAATRTIRQPQKLKWLEDITRLSKIDEEEDRIQDNKIANKQTIRIGNKYWDLAPKIAVLEPLSYMDSIADAIENNDDRTAADIFNIPFQWIAPYKSALESILNYNIRTGKQIDYGKGNQTKYIFGIPIPARAAHTLKAYIRQYRILDQALDDPKNDNQSITDTLKYFSSNLPAVLLGSTYNKNIKRTAIEEKKKLNKESRLIQTMIDRTIAKTRNHTLSPEEYQQIYEDLRSKQQTIIENDQRMAEINSALEEQERARLELLLGPDQTLTEENRPILEKFMDTIGDKLDEALKQLTDKNARYLRKPIHALPITVYDGDTIEIQLENGLKEVVRISGIDTTDIGKNKPIFGDFSKLTDEQNNIIYEEAREYVKKFLEENKDELRFQIADSKIRDIYNRPIVSVSTTSGRDLAEELIALGLAEPFWRGKPKDEETLKKYKKLYYKAKKNKVGAFRFLNLLSEAS